MFQPKPYASSIAVPLYRVEWAGPGPRPMGHGANFPVCQLAVRLARPSNFPLGLTLFTPLTPTLRTVVQTTVLMKTRPKYTRELGKTFAMPGRITSGRVLLAASAVIAATGLLFAQGRWSNHRPILQTYDPNTTPPPLPLPDAYALAVHTASPPEGLSRDTNHYYCVAASCLSMTNNGNTGWEFRFFSTNRQSIRVVVYFDKEVVVRPQ